jgi:DHA1 family quinolone resistance protein-like MFS transporter
MVRRRTRAQGVDRVSEEEEDDLAARPRRVSDTATLLGIQLLANQAAAATGLFIPNFARLLGASTAMLGVVGASFGVAVFTSSFIFSRRTDVEGSKRYLPLGLLVATLSVSLLFLVATPPALLLAYTLVGVGLGMFPATLVAYVFGKKVRLGKFSSVGSLGAGVGLLAAGVVADHYAVTAVFLFGAGALLVAFLLSASLPSLPQTRHRVPFFPTALFRRYVAVFLPYLLRHVAANIVWIIYPLYLQSLGLSYLLVSVLYTVNPFVQFILMYAVTDRVAATRLLALGFLFSATAFLGLFLSTTAWHIVAVQLSVAASWAFLYVGALRQVTEGNVRKATTTGLLTSIISLGNIVGPLVGGLISELTGIYRENMLVATLLAASALPVYLLLARRADGA